MTERVAAVVPIRSLRDGKVRLAADLTPEQRQAAISTMLRHVVATLLDAGSIDDLVVVTSDDEAAGFAASLDPQVAVIRQGESRPGLIGAIDLGREWAVARGADRMLVVFGDLPLLGREDVDVVLASDAPVVVARDRHGEGTNVLAVPLDEVGRQFAFKFGEGSAARHAAEAGRLGLPVAFVDRVGTGFDLDDARDLDDLGSVPGLPVAAEERR